ncbi:MAG TPA: hypothetical protein VFH17_07435, partial [Coriobacteriia bacterium]|nr:hypothetical protein [Coriobacteriia bacterium]
MSTFHDMTCTPDTCRVPIGVYYRDDSVPTYNASAPGAGRPGWEHAREVRDISGVIDALA